MRASHFPYCLMKQEDGSWLVLNRSKKPIGFTTQARVDYGDFPIALKCDLANATLRRLAHDGSIFGGKIVYLYPGDRPPEHHPDVMEGYLKRLALLMGVAS